MPTYEITSKAYNIDVTNQYDIDDNIVNNINSRYYSANEIKNMGTANSFNIIHSNLNGLENKFDDYHKIRPFVSTSILLNIYHAIIYPLLLYGVSVWGNAYKILLEPIYIMQKTFVRMATYNDSYPATPGPLVHTPPLFH